MKHNKIPVGGWRCASAKLLCCALLVLLSPKGWSATVITNFNTPGTYTWTCPSGVTTIQVECWGGGGAGGSGWQTNTLNVGHAGGGGGAGGAYARKASVPVTAGNDYTITIPAVAVAAEGFNRQRPKLEAN